MAGSASDHQEAELTACHRFSPVALLLVSVVAYLALGIPSQAGKTHPTPSLRSDGPEQNSTALGGDGARVADGSSSGHHRHAEPTPSATPSLLASTSPTASCTPSASLSGTPLPSPSPVFEDVKRVNLSEPALRHAFCSDGRQPPSLLLALDPRTKYGRASNMELAMKGLMVTGLSLDAMVVLPGCLNGMPTHQVKRWAPEAAHVAAQLTTCWTSLALSKMGGGASGPNALQGIDAVVHWSGGSGKLDGELYQGNASAGWVPHDTTDEGCSVAWRSEESAHVGPASLPVAAWPAGWRKDDKGWLQARAEAERTQKHQLVVIPRRHIFYVGLHEETGPPTLLSHSLHAVAAWMLAAAYGPAARVVGVHVRRGDWAASCVKMEDCFISDEQYVAGAADALARFDMHNIYIASNDPKALLALLHKEVPLPPFTPALSPTDAAAGTPGRPMAVLPVLAGQYRSARARRAAAPANATTSPAPSSLLGLQVHRILTLDDLMTALTQMCKGAGTASGTLPPFVRVQDPAQEHVHDYMLPDTCAVWHSWAPGGKATGKMLGWLDKAVLTLASCVMGTPRSTFSEQAFDMRRAQFGPLLCDHFVEDTLLPV